ncbi:DUF6600 domain-containing protein [Neoroseomonas oryzicola]|uniref:FecR protein domain-containing protein n=2 Tax=Neoroseomonas oryzicola TaxID=535904 RepID=A0ABX1EQ57_9PROT|nr:DUF6600 domain-containing protein [Neoroseomonas oryzicola]NKE19969.1 hypothetical protein [Neoroseomonas oryzicola]
MRSPGTRAAILALPLAMLLPAPLPAQPMQPPIAGVDATAAEPMDPPGRVGRIARLTGQVSYRLPGEEQWRPAARNLPITEGNAIYAAPGGRALLEVGQSRIALEGGSDLQMAALDDTALAATLARGAAYVTLSGLAPGEAAQIVTPQAGVTMPVQGRYLFEVPENGPSRVAVLEGEALLATSGGEMRLTSGQAAILAEGAPPRIEHAGPGSPLVAWADGVLPQPRYAVPAAAAGMTGIGELAAYGTWAPSPEYGQVWYPNVGATWAPYRDGYWEWVEPWGWTWIDAQPWGYAPSHYGRWVQVGPRWAWAPVVVVAVGASMPRPVWAPANVRFFGGGYRSPGYAPVAWVPLAPREAYYPWYRASPRYVERMNGRYVPDVRQVTNAWMQDRDGRRGETIDQFRNRRYATLVPAEAMQRSRPVRQEMARVRQEDWRRIGALQEGAPRPGPGTPGMTPTAAERLGIAPDALRRGPVRQGPPAEPHAALRERLPEGMRGRPEPRPSADRRPDAPPAGRPAGRADVPAPPRDATPPRAGAAPAPGGPRPPMDEAQRQAVEQQRRLMEDQQRRAADRPGRVVQEQQRAPAPPPRPSDERQGARPEGADQQRRAAEQQQRQGIEQQRRASEDQQRRAAEQQQRQALEQQRRASEDQQRRAAEQQQRQAVEQQRRASEDQQRRAAEQQQRQAIEQQRRASEDQQRRAAEQQQRQAIEQQRRASEDQQRRAVEQQQRQAIEQQRRAAEQQQRQAAEQQQRRAAEQQQRQADQRRNQRRED